jgi:hypothetical protein
MVFGKMGAQHIANLMLASRIAMMGTGIFFVLYENVILA